jgi:Ni,Fe-hydrogenase III large subunit
VLKKVEEEVASIHRAIVGDSAIHRRTKGVGHLTTEQARHWSLVGPVARARGIDIDTRRDHPYAAYDQVRFEVPVLDGGDVWATLVVRVLETFQSIGIIRQVLERMPGDGPLLAELDRPIPPRRHAIAAIEAPRGEVVHYLITGDENRPERWRVRAPTYPNLQGVPLMLLDNQFADLPIIIGSIDPCFSCTDRLVRIDLRSGRSTLLSGPELQRMAARRTAGPA